MNKRFHLDFNFIGKPISFGDTSLVQLGRLHCLSSDIIKKHAHLNWYEITIVTDGEGVIITNNEPLEVKKGDIYISFPGDFHEMKSSLKNPLKYDFFSFQTKNQSLKKALKQMVLTTRTVNQRIIKEEQINIAVSNAIEEMSLKREFNEEILSLIFEQIIFLLLRALKSDEPLASNKKHNSSLEELCFQIMHYIDSHIYTIENLSVLAERFRYNYSYLSNIFNKATGTTISEYYQARRLDAALLLLKENNLKVKEVAEMLRYSSLYAFSKAFKQHYGISPKNYKLKNNN